MSPLALPLPLRLPALVRHVCCMGSRARASHADVALRTVPASSRLPSELSSALRQGSAR